MRAEPEPWIAALKVGDTVVIDRHLRDSYAFKVTAISPTGRITAGPWTFNPDGSERGADTWSRAHLREATPERLGKIAHAQRVDRLRHAVKWGELAVSTVAEICALLDRDASKGVEAAHGA